MRISSIGQNYSYNSLYNKKNIKSCKSEQLKYINNQTVPSFKGDRGAIAGMAGGFVAGAALTALIIATGGLAGVVAAVGAATTTVAGGAACIHLGGIAGATIEEKIDNKNNNNNSSDKT